MKDGTDTSMKVSWLMHSLRTIMSEVRNILDYGRPSGKIVLWVGEDFFQMLNVLSQLLVFDKYLVGRLDFLLSLGFGFPLFWE